MAKHRVNFNVPDRPLAHADIIFTVFQDDEKFGELRISKGNLVWYPGNKVYGYSLTWEKINELAQDRGKRVRGRKRVD